MFDKKISMKMADAIFPLEEYVRGDNWVPIGLDGYAICSAMDYRQNMCRDVSKYSIASNRNHFLANILQASSKTGEIDKRKLHTIFNWQTPINSIAFIDLRTKSGSLGKMLKKEVEDYKRETGKYIDAYYAVLFDPEGKADFGARNYELSDEDRPMWLPNKEMVKNFLGKNDSGIYYYNLDFYSLDDSLPLNQIKMDIMDIENCNMIMPRKKGALK